MKRLTVEETRAQNTIEVDLGDGRSVIAKRLDVMFLVLEGILPMPLLAAVQRMIGLAREKAPIDEQYETIKDHSHDMVAMMRRHAIAVVIDPPLGPDSSDPKKLDVTLLRLNQLTRIWAATTLAPSMEDGAADEFRATPRSDAPPAAPDGAAVLEAAVVVDSSNHDIVTM